MQSLKKSDIRLICHVAGRSEDAIYSWSPIDLWYFCSLRLGQFKRIMLSCFGLFLVILDVVAHFLIMFFHSWVMFSSFFVFVWSFFVVFWSFQIFSYLVPHFLVVVWSFFGRVLVYNFLSFSGRACKNDKKQPDNDQNNQTMTKKNAKQLPKNDKHMSNQIWNEHNMTKKQPSKANDQTITKKWLD